MCIYVLHRTPHLSWSTYIRVLVAYCHNINTVLSSRQQQDSRTAACPRYVLVPFFLLVSVRAEVSPIELWQRSAGSRRSRVNVLRCGTTDTICNLVVSITPSLQGRVLMFFSISSFFFPVFFQIWRVYGPLGERPARAMQHRNTTNRWFSRCEAKSRVFFFSSVYTTRTACMWSTYTCMRAVCERGM